MVHKAYFEVFCKQKQFCSCFLNLKIPLITTNVVLFIMLCYYGNMPRLSIDITPEEHQKLKAIAALKGQSIKDFVLKRTLGEAPVVDDMSEDEALEALSDFLKPRIEQARRGELSTKSFEDIRKEAHRRAGL